MQAGQSYSVTVARRYTRRKTHLKRDDNLGIGETVQHVQQVAVAFGRDVVAAKRIASGCIKAG